jgi:hypothetical protein
VEVGRRSNKGRGLNATNIYEGAGGHFGVQCRIERLFSLRWSVCHPVAFLLCAVFIHVLAYGQHCSVASKVINIGYCTLVSYTLK